MSQEIQVASRSWELLPLTTRRQTSVFWLQGMIVSRKLWLKWIFPKNIKSLSLILFVLIKWWALTQRMGLYMTIQPVDSMLLTVCGLCCGAFNLSVYSSSSDRTVSEAIVNQLRMGKDKRKFIKTCEKVLYFWLVITMTIFHFSFT